jgi:Family of unknown function (DUF6155)
MKRPSVREVRSFLQGKTQEELINDILFFYGKFEGVKEFISLQMGVEFSDDLLEKHRAIIQREFFPARGYGKIRLSIARKAITDYKKTSPNIPGLVELMVFYVEMGVRFTREYGDIHEQFYTSMESMYQDAIRYITQYELQGKYQQRCKAIVEDTRGMGWGFHDTLSDIYFEAFTEEDD